MIRLKVALFMSERINGPEQPLSLVCSIAGAGRAPPAPAAVSSCAGLQTTSKAGDTLRGCLHCRPRGYEISQPSQLTVGSACM